MASSELIDEFFDLPAIGKQKDSVLAMLKELEAAKDKFNNAKITLQGSNGAKDIRNGVQEATTALNGLNEASKTTVNQFGKVVEATKAAAAQNQIYGRSGDVVVQTQKDIAKATADANEIVKKFSGSIQDNISRQIQLKQDLQGVKDAQKELGKQYAGSATSVEAYSNTLIKLGEDEARIKAQISEVGIAIRQQAKELEATEGSIDQYSISLGRMKDAYRQWSQVERESEQGKQVLAAIQKLDPAVKGFDESMGNFQRSVGNYAKGMSNYSDAIDILKKSFADVGSKLDQLSKDENANKDVVEQLNKEYDLLNRLVNTQEAGFANATAEIRANQQALLQMEQQGLSNTDAFRQLALETGDLKDQIADLRVTTQALGSDTFVFDGMIQAAQGLAGVYGVAEGAVALFGEENEELQKTMVKLQAIMTVIQGLQAVANTLQKESSAALLFNVAVTKMQGAAESKNIVIRYAAIAAQKLLNFAMSAAGGPIFGIIAGIGLLLVSLKAFASNNDKATKSQADLNRELENAMEINDRYNEGLKRRGEIEIAKLELQGVSEQQIRERRLQLLKDELKAQEELEGKTRSSYDKALDLRRQNAFEGRKLDEDEVEAMNSTIKNFETVSKKKIELMDAVELEELKNRKASKEEVEKFESDIQAKREEANEKTKASNEKRLADQKAFSEKERKARFEIAKMALEDKLKDQTGIIDDPKSRTDEKLIALQEATAIKQSILEGEKNFELANAELTGSERLLITSKYLSSLRDLERENSQQVADVIRESGEEAKAAEIERLAKRREAIEEDFAIQQSSLSGLRDQELLIVDQKFNAGLVKEKEYREQRLAIQKKFADQAIENEIRYYSELLKTVDISEKDRFDFEAKIAALRLKKDEDITNAKIDNLGKIEDAEQKLADKLRELGEQLFTTFQDVVKGRYDAEKNSIQELIEKGEEKKQKEIDAVAALTISEEEKANRIIVINARAAAEKEKLELRQRQLEQQKARFEKAIQIAGIIAATAKAVMAALGSVPYSPINIATAGVTAAIGAAQLASVLATPIPKFRHGTNDAPGGLVIVGDGGKKEVIVYPSGDAFITPDKPTLADVPKHSTIYPDVETAVANAQIMAFKSLAKIPVVDPDNYSKEMTRSLQKELRAVKSAIEAKPVPRVVNTWSGVQISFESQRRYYEWLNRNI